MFSRWFCKNQTDLVGVIFSIALFSNIVEVLVKSNILFLIMVANKYIMCIYVNCLRYIGQFKMERLFFAIIYFIWVSRYWNNGSIDSENDVTHLKEKYMILFLIEYIFVTIRNIKSYEIVVCMEYLFAMLASVLTMFL